MSEKDSLKTRSDEVNVVRAVGSQNSLLLDNVEPVDITVRNLSISVREGVASAISTLFKRKKKVVGFPDEEKLGLRSHILQSISADVPRGTMMAIIGGSGSGKTSMLNVMAQRMSSNSWKIDGEIKFDGMKGISHVRHAYVLQQDILQPRLTCRESLTYAADLRLGSTTSAKDRKRLVEEIILELGLKECADTLVGDSGHKGLSGGEKRRLTIGIQLLANPSVLFLDEPTTGLDANSAYLLVKTCHYLSSVKGRTIVMSIHQPRSDIFFLFDSVTILSRGSSVYSGPIRNVLPYFTDLGHTFPEHINPADRLIDLSAVDTRTLQQEAASLERVNSLIQNWKDNQYFSTVAVSERNHESPKQLMKASLAKEVTILTRRSMLLSFRDPMGILGLLLEAMLMGVVLGLIFLRLKGDLAGIRSMLGLIYAGVSAQAYLILLYETYRLCGPDLKVFDREHNEDCVSVFGYLISRRLAKALTEDLFVPLIFSVIVYFMGGLRTDSPSHFFIFFAVCLIEHYTAMTFAMFAASISRDFTNAALIANLGFTLQSMACGYFVNAAQMPVYVRWTKYIAYLYYGFVVAVNNQFDGYFGDCPSGNMADPACVPYTGSFIITSLGLPTNWITLGLCVGAAWAIGFYVVAAFFLKFFRVSISVSKTHKFKSDDKTFDAEEIIANTTQQIDVGVKIAVKDLNLSVQRRAVGIKSKQINILRGIYADFEPGAINAILGPSGSGKSSLLNYMAGRLNSSTTQKYRSAGDFFFNNMAPSKAVVRSICSYVAQEDDGLLASLTVRETLYFAAYLRLPTHMSRKQKRARADEIISKMGLNDCADTLIGGEFVKGISGGEKRRVTICIQLLNDPKVLLLDEPTSGLDAFTAGSILQVLKALAEEGRTIICTIHQPRSDLFPHFGNMLLLARGGQVAYNGKSSDMLKFFAEAGYPCPSLTNPADHVLDLVSVNLQEEQKEIESRDKVLKLIERWTKVQTERESMADNVMPRHSADQPAVFSRFVREPAPFYFAFTTLLQRTTVNLSRSPDMIVARIMQVVGIGLVLALYFSPLRDNDTAVTNRLGLIQELSAVYFVGMLNNMAVYPYERSVFYGEYDDNVYGVLPFFLVYTALEIPFEILTSFLFAIFLAVIPGLPRTVEMVLATVYCTFVTVHCGESIGIIFNTLFTHEGFTVNIVSVIISTGTMMGGIMSLTMPAVLKGINWISPTKYSNSIMVNLAFKDLQITCSDSTMCQFTTGEQVLEQYFLKANFIPYFGALAIIVVVYRLIALTVLKINRLKLGIESFRR